MTSREDVLPIDRGWAWIVVLVSTSLHAIAVGGAVTHGVILVELLERFEEVYSPSTLLWVFTTSSIVGCLAGPVISILIVRLGYRPAAMIGVVLLAVSHIGLAYAFNLPTLLIFYSLPTGVGIDMIYLSVLLVSAPYFKKRRALAVSLIACGAGLGIFTIPHILRFLFRTMDFSGAMLLYAGFVLQFLCLASLLRPMSYYERLYNNQLSALPPKDVTLLDETEIETSDETTKDSTSLLEPEIRLRSASVHHQPSHSTDEVTNKLHHSMSQLEIKPSDTKRLNLQVHNSGVGHFVSLGEPSGSIFFIEVEDNTGEDKKSKDSSLNWRLMLMPKFAMVCVSIAVAQLAFAVIYTCVPAMGKEAGVSKETVALALMLSGGIEIPCKIAIGIFADRKIMSVTALYSLCLLMAGLLTLLSPIIYGLPGVVIGLIGVSSTGSSVFNLLPVVLRELIGQEHVTSGMGLQHICQAVPLIASSYITGVIYDATGSWRVVFFYIAVSLIAGSAVVWPYLIIMRCKLNLFTQKAKNVTSRAPQQLNE